jgi:hypothetical protein
MEKPDSKLETYAFLRLYEHDFEMALNTLKILRRCRNNEVRYALLRDIIITYCRPFAESKGKEIKRHRFGFGKFESESMKNLHKKIMGLRSSLFAHTDLIVKNPQIANWSTTERKWFPMSFAGFDYVQLDSEALEIEHLIKYSKKQLLEQIRKLENGF